MFVRRDYPFQGPAEQRRGSNGAIAVKYRPSTMATRTPDDKLGDASGTCVRSPRPRCGRFHISFGGRALRSLLKRITNCTGERSARSKTFIFLLKFAAQPAPSYAPQRRCSRSHPLAFACLFNFQARYFNLIFAPQNLARKTLIKWTPAINWRSSGLAVYFCARIYPFVKV